MRQATARAIVRDYNAWVEARAGTNERRAAKQILDDQIKQAQREEAIEAAHARLGLPFNYIGEAEEWPRPGESYTKPPRDRR